MTWSGGNWENRPVAAASADLMLSLTLVFSYESGQVQVSLLDSLDRVQMRSTTVDCAGE